MPEEVQNTASEVAAAPAAEATTSTTAAASTSSSANAADDGDAALTRAAEAAIAGKPVAEIAQAFNKPRETPATQGDKGAEAETENVETEAADLAESPEGEQPAVNLADKDKNLLSRFQMDPEDLPANPERRERVLGNLRQRAVDQDRMGRENAEMRRQLTRQPGEQSQAQTQQQQAAPAITSDDEMLKPLVDYFGPEVANPVAGVVKALVQREIAPMVQAQKAALTNMEIQHTHEGFADAAKLAPESIKLSDKAVKDAVLKEAWKQIYAKAQSDPDFSPHEYNLKHAIPDAVSLLYQQDIKKAERMRLATRQKTALSGSPERGTRSPTGSPKLSDEDRLDAAAEAAANGRPFKEIQSAYAGSR